MSSQSPHLVERFVDVATDLLKERLQSSGVRIGQTLGKLEIDGEPDQALLRAVVELALDAAALRVCSRGQPRTGCPELLDLEAQVVVRG